MANNARTNRSRQFGLGLVLALLITVGIWPVNVMTGNASPGRKAAAFDIVPDSTNPAIPTSATQGTFVLTGKVYRLNSVNKSTCAPTEDPLGTWTATVVVTPPITSINSVGAPSSTANRFHMHHTIVLESFPGIIEVGGLNGLFSASGAARLVDNNFPTGPTVGPGEVQTATGGASRYEGLDGSATILPYCGPPLATLATTPPGPFRFDRAFCIAINQSVD
jgi:hypothetical protein